MAFYVLFIGFGVSGGHGMNPESRLKSEKDKGQDEEASSDLFSVSPSVCADERQRFGYAGRP